MIKYQCEYMDYEGNLFTKIFIGINHIKIADNLQRAGFIIISIIPL